MQDLKRSIYNKDELSLNHIASPMPSSTPAPSDFMELKLRTGSFISSKSFLGFQIADVVEGLPRPILEG